MVEGGRTPLLKNAELEALGYNITIYPTASIYVATKAMVDLWTALKNDDTTAGVIDTMVTFSEFNDLMGLEKIREVEHNYATGR
ncbi:MAG: 2,3-dimethylmalate lyase, partial [Eubacterium sp.]